MLRDVKPNIVNMVTLPLKSCELDAISIRIPAIFIMELSKLMVKFIKAKS